MRKIGAIAAMVAAAASLFAAFKRFRKANEVTV